MPLTDHSAVASAVGYYYQGLYALLLLLDAPDDAAVSVESQDDVVLHGPTPTLHQLKHSLGTPAPLNAKSDGLWKTLRIWTGQIGEESPLFVFVTCARIAAGSSLTPLLVEDSDREGVLAELVAEAKNVRDVRREQCLARKKPSYETRAPGCQAFLALKPAERRQLVERIRIAPEQPNAAKVPAEISSRFRSYVLPEIRDRLVERLIEWWDRQVALTLLHKRTTQISKRELTAKIQELIAEHSDVNLSDDYSQISPESLDSELGGWMERQIHLVNGGQSRLMRAAQARWRARNQRARWMTDDLRMATALHDYDNLLVERWSDRHGPVREQCAKKNKTLHIVEGLRLLDWSHLDAPNQVERIRPAWDHHFLVQGSYQQLADDRKVGWHPFYRDLLGIADDDNENKD